MCFRVASSKVFLHARSTLQNKLLDLVKTVCTLNNCSKQAEPQNSRMSLWPI